MEASQGNWRLLRSIGQYFLKDRPWTTYVKLTGRVGKGPFFKMQVSGFCLRTTKSEELGEDLGKLYFEQFPQRSSVHTDL